MSIGGFQEWALSQSDTPEHQLIGAACICGDWTAGCGNDVTEQWRQHVNAAEALVTRPGEHQ